MQPPAPAPAGTVTANQPHGAPDQAPDHGAQGSGHGLQPPAHAPAGTVTANQPHGAPDLLSEGEAEIRTAVPQFEVAKLLGTSAEIFFQSAGQPRGQLANLSGTHRTGVELGKLTFKLTASPVSGVDGSRIGAIVEFEEKTQELAVEREVDAVIEAVADGDFTKEVALEGKQGFMRKLAEGMNRLSALVESATSDLARTLAALAEGNLAERISADYQGRFGELKTNANHTVEQLASIVTQIQAVTSGISGAVGEINTGAEDLAMRTEQQASNLEETAASMEEMSATVKQNAENAQHADQLAASANQVAQRGGTVVSDAVAAMSRIEDSSQKIADIIGVIDEIAFQTNLLALNAAVEAARAGEAGKGFAVVASEVRTLAQRSSQAAKDIKGLIQSSGHEVKDGVKLVNDAGGALQEIVASIRKVADIVAEISAASKEQSSGIEQINGAVAQMDEMTQQNSAMVEESAAAARTLANQADKLRELMGFFRLAHGAGAPPATVAAGAERAVRPAAQPRPAAKPGAAKPGTAKAAARPGSAPAAREPALAGGDDGWKEF